MTPGLMQDWSLTIPKILTHAARAHPTQEIVSRAVDEPVRRYDFATFARRCERSAKAWRRLGVSAGDRVSSLAWNTFRHMELFYALPGIGAVLHTANPRLFEEQIVYTINHAGSVILAFEASFADLVARIAPQLETVRTYVILAGPEVSPTQPAGVLNYETLLSAETAGFTWPELDENAGAFLCYTSGTTGNPKGALYSHRSVVLHAMIGAMPSAFALTPFDAVLPGASLYHATAWGLPFAVLLAGAKIVLPAEKLDPATLHQLISAEGVTFSVGVPTIWAMYLAHIEALGETPGKLNRVVVAGSAMPRDMALKFKALGVTALHLWGMTEMSPLGVASTPTPALMNRGEEEAQDVLWTRQGRLLFGVELKVVDEDGQEVRWDSATPGAVKVRGPCVIRRYWRAEESAVDTEGWFDTHDIGVMDPEGFLKLTDRAKDVIKSGGEWISSIDLENAAAGFPGVKVAAVIGAHHPKWQERPVLILETFDGQPLSTAAVLAHLEARVAKWWLPDRIIFAPVPLTAVGKIDKKRLRQSYQDALIGA